MPFWDPAETEVIKTGEAALSETSVTMKIKNPKGRLFLPIARTPTPAVCQKEKNPRVEDGVSNRRAEGNDGYKMENL
jgi:hypothetical protein